MSLGQSGPMSRSDGLVLPCAPPHSGLLPPMCSLSEWAAGPGQLLGLGYCSPHSPLMGQARPRGY